MSQKPKLLKTLLGPWYGYKSFRIFKHIDTGDEQKVAQTLASRSNFLNISQAGTDIGVLHYLTQQQKEKLVETFVKRSDISQYINQADNNLHWAPLHFASQNGNRNIAELLINAGADIRKATQSGIKSIQIASGHNNISIVQLLHQRGIHIDDSDTSHNWTNLHYAAFNNCLDVAKYCIENSADPTKQDNDHFTPIYLAAHQGHVEMIDYLYVYKKGWNYPEAPCKLIHLASKQQQPLLLEYLQGKGHDLWETDKQKASAIHYTTINGSTECLRWLLKQKLPVNRQDQSGCTALHLAVITKDLAIIRELILAGADIDIPNNKGLSPKDIAESYNDKKLLSTIRKLMKVR